MNESLNVIRGDYDRLKATLTNCIRFGPADQNRASYEDFRAHLLGRVSFVEMINPPRARRLREALAVLARRQREVLHLVFYGDLSVDQAARPAACISSSITFMPPMATKTPENIIPPR